ncbi:MAG TPA: hypothetical protein VJ754_03615, partial [Anaerolineae bacterium]|nr:hypothetical protein [Anaerolineae bacterium]
PPQVTMVASATADPVALIPTAMPTPPTPTATPVPPLHQLTEGGCCVQPLWSPDSQQVWFLDKLSDDAPAGYYAVNIDEPLLPPFRVLDLMGIYSRDLSLVAYPEGRDTIVERLADGERWAIPNQGQSVVFSPGAKRIAWEIEDIDGPFDQRKAEVYLARFDGADPALVASMFGGGLIGWLDEQRILFAGRPSLDVRDRTLTALDTASNIAVDLVTAERISGVVASPEGTWLAYFISFNEDASRNSVWIQRSDGSGARKLDFWGAYQWRDDSRLLYIPVRKSTAEPFVIYEHDTETGRFRPLTDPATAPLQIANGDWRVSPDGRYVVYISSEDRNLWLVELRP